MYNARSTGKSRTRVPRTTALDFLMAGLMVLLIYFLIAPPGFEYEGPGVIKKYAVTQGGVSGPLILTSVMLVAAFALLRRSVLTARLFRQLNVFLLLFVALATASILWSADSAATARRLFRLYAIVFGCCGFVLVGWHPRRFQTVVRLAVTLILLGSVILGLVAPELAIEQGTSAELLGAWKGLAMQKNSFGAISAVGVIFWLHASLAHESKKLVATCGLALSGICLLLSRSSTSVLSTIFVVLLILLLLRTRPAMRRFLPYVITAFAGLILTYSLAVLHLVPGLSALLEPIMALTGKDMSFSGRTIIWDIVIENIYRHPLLGGGYGAYWTGPVPGSPSYEFVWRTYIYPTESHNGYLEVVNDLGFVGGFCLIGYLITFLRQSLRIFAFDRSQGTLYLALLFQAFVANLSEAHWFSVSAVQFAILTLATTSMARQLMDRHQSTRRSPAGSATVVRSS